MRGTWGWAEEGAEDEGRGLALESGQVELPFSKMASSRFGRPAETSDCGNTPFAQPLRRPRGEHGEVEQGDSGAQRRYNIAIRTRQLWEVWGEAPCEEGAPGAGDCAAGSGAAGRLRREVKVPGNVQQSFVSPGACGLVSLTEGTALAS